jgi:peptide-methionine (S)-S-oxide reductase
MRSRSVPTIPTLLAVALCVALVAMSRAGGAADGGAASTMSKPATETATFAGGCFWCMEPPFDAVDGVLSTTVGYTGGTTVDPTYEQVSAGGTGHAESIQIVFDPRRVTYAQLLNVFWRNVDPTNPNGQFCDVGDQYRTAIFYHSEAQKQAAERSKALLEASGKLNAPIVTQIVAASTFYPAEDYHQDYYEKNPIRYKFYRYRCGRDQRLEELWGDH